MSVWTDPSPSDWDRWAERLLNGEEPSEAAKAEGQTCSAFRRVDPGRQRQLLEMSREIRAGADRELVRDKLREVTANTDHPQWARSAELLAKHAGMFDETQRIELMGAEGGPVEVTVEHDYDRLLDKLEQVGLLTRGPTTAAHTARQQLLPAPAD